MAPRFAALRGFVFAVGAAATGQVQWVQKSTISGQGCPMAFDAARGRAIVFSGLGETFSFDGTAWARLTPATSPSARCGHALAFDAARGRVVLFGGHNEYPPFQDYGDTWEWDGTTWLLRVPAVQPPQRWGYAMVYDSARQLCVLFGGGNTAPLADTWEWDGVNWRQIPSPNRPSARYFVGMAYDAARAVTVLFGGNDDVNVFGDTWEWNGTDWTQRTLAAAPPARYAHGMTYDAPRQRTVVFGGNPPGSGACRGDTWEWDGTTWTQRVSAGTPAARYRPGFVFDTRNSRVLMFSGNTGTRDYAGLTDTWGWDGQGWTRILPHLSPVAGAMAYDTARHRAVMHGGYMAATAQLAETWEWDGQVWTQRSPATSPPPRAYTAVAYDQARGRLVLFGGDTGAALPNDTWEWDGSNWLLRAPAQSPPGRVSHAMAYDAARGVTVLFGGLGASGPLLDTWEWDGSTWQNRPVVPFPPSFAAHAMSYDRARGVTVLFGGLDPLFAPMAQTWEWNGTSWSMQTPPHVPGGRYQAMLAYDSARERTVLFGGYFVGTELFDSWEWDGGDWTQRTPALMPRTLAGNSICYDLDRETIVLFANQTWEYGATAQARYTRYGSGCAGTSGTPALDPALGKRPWIGDSFALVVRNTPSPLLGIASLGFSDQSWLGVPLPLDLSPAGMPGCWLLASAEALLALPPSGVLTLPVPNDPSLLGGRFFNQALVVDLPANALGVITSNAGSGTFGAR